MRTLPLTMLLCTAAPLAAQQAYETTLVIQQAGREIGREEFTLRQGRARGLTGSTLVAAARYPATNPTLQIAATLERAEDLALAKFQLDVESPDGNSVILAAGSGTRLIVRTVAQGSEAGREMPGGADVVLLDDAVYSLYTAVAALATPNGARLTGVFPRTGRRVAFTARRVQAENAGPVRTILEGGLAGTITTDAQGRLQRLEFPSSQTVVTRLQE